MRIYRHYETLPQEARGAAIAVGNFDGVHLGHRGVIGEAGRIARSANLPWAVLTFEPHPRRVFKPDQPAFRLTPFRAKARALDQLGVDIMIVQRFNAEFSRRPAEDFVTQVLVNGFGARHVVAGYDFVFGHNRGGNCEVLLAMGQKLGFGFTAVSAVEDAGGEVYSSTRVRNSLRAGNVKGAADILGRPFEIEGRVAHGDKRGRTIGFPTLNLHLGSVVRPQLGVYAVRIGHLDGDAETWMDGVANIGVRPTFGGQDVVLEAHAFDFDGDLYGQRITVALVERIREEKKFDGLDALKAQIAADSDTARGILNELQANET
ncbi:MAG: bifunctional riboflavin kinase/FAD synthetase [Rhodospirillaceae bacterium]|nr:bifunctional riboflavin kinase/FAD synthetase [Rhodospirillaceae bacterium]